MAQSPDTSHPGPTPAADPGLLAQLRQVLGAEAVIVDPVERALAASDILPAPDAVIPDLVLRPRDTSATAAAMRLLAEAGIAVVPRGAGLSYTDGVVPHSPGVVIDTVALTTIEVLADDLTAIVGAGCTWASVAAALKPYRLRPAVVPPISGSHSTVGGAAAQGVAGAEGIIGLAVVLADGSTVRTGSWSTPSGRPFWRHYGPDLTGLFIGDCGAFGIKTEVMLRLLPAGEKRFASFAFDTGGAVVVTIARIQRGPGGRAMAFDRARAADATGGISAGEAMRTAATVIGRAQSLGQAVRDVGGLLRARDDLAEPAWSLHITAEGATAEIADAQLAAMRRICLDAGGSPISPAIPQALDARPFSVRGMVGQQGERWVPVHGYLPLSAAAQCMAAIEAMLAHRMADLQRHAVRVNWLVAANAGSVTMEPMFYWPDSLDPLHLKHLSERNRIRFGKAEPDIAARDYVRGLRDAVRDIMDQHGAAHGQIGRFYVPPHGALLQQIKSLLDPQHLLNPGVLGL